MRAITRTEKFERVLPVCVAKTCGNPCTFIRYRDSWVLDIIGYERREGDTCFEVARQGSVNGMCRLQVRALYVNLSDLEILEQATLSVRHEPIRCYSVDASDARCLLRETL